MFLASQHQLIACLPLLVALFAAGCNSDVKNDITAGTDTAGTTVDQPAQTSGAASNGSYSLQVGTGSISVAEGGGTANINIQVERANGHAKPITFAAEGQSQADTQGLSWQFSSSQIRSGESNTSLSLELAIGPRPLQPHDRVVRIIGTDGANSPVIALLTVQVTPTTRPDVYVIAGQSNAVGFSESNAKLTGPGQADEPVDRIKQLNVTGNDQENFITPSDFTDIASIAVADPRYTRAVDPLHEGFDTTISGKAATYIGMGLSFAKAALPNTASEIYLVPTAWGDTGFCKRSTNLFTGLGWNTTEPSNPVFSGTLLHDRAIARINLTLQETGGILRGILWHQGEAEADDPECAAMYAENLQAMVTSFRTLIVEDARGAVARGINSDVPFVLGTMAKGADERGALTPFRESKVLVDSVHRNIGSLIPHAAVVNADDLVPPGYACGEGSCIHFGAAAYREMGRRYYRELVGILDR